MILPNLISGEYAKNIQFKARNGGKICCQRNVAGKGKQTYVRSDEGKGVRERSMIL